jgi:NAD(P)H-dependent FMN reductase
MRLVIFNGSPRYKKSNSAILIEHFLKGYKRIKDNTVPVYYLANKGQRESSGEIFRQASTVIVVFPLYTDCMPGIVKEFIEIIAQQSFFGESKKVGFVVQSGFPESIHSSFLEKYLRKLTLRLNCEYLGTVIKGGVEGIQIMPASMTKKLHGQFESLGEYFGQNESFEQKTMNELRKPYTFSHTHIKVFNFLSRFGLTNFYWNSNLKKNGAYQQRFARPYKK